MHMNAITVKNLSFGADSHCPSNPGAVDADIMVGRVLLAGVTLTPCAYRNDRALTTGGGDAFWQWAGDDYAWKLARMSEAQRCQISDIIQCAVRAAVAGRDIGEALTVEFSFVVPLTENEIVESFWSSDVVDSVACRMPLDVNDPRRPAAEARELTLVVEYADELIEKECASMLAIREKIEALQEELQAHGDELRYLHSNRSDALRGIDAREGK